ncbi:hypothetical protein LXG23DRAFT_26568 [Yarrowia lipolytica]|uniref:F-box domain-containing protein n=1 Tax=Yarrowia lipolytica TaxID=4952 RepID=A0A1D8N4R8_YARLL|nr:hypothetical protein YALI1_A14099g [Yarrowia lipolytica]KAB8283252.1 hypothetical protein BKA91DRAFT_137082 [Yarrowia lipolytica]KAE8174044.1 hypothetical protein BKA90DRAFT_134705 [Yarrowia lipolytica]KAJ8051656.1 hypothetical protein LXG23DRAFT_26568 [Yarrowia lipolytica]RMI95168.1 hypothetical protein BD777DRAFT_130427 [Yarrowia lipolytica]
MNSLPSEIVHLVVGHCPLEACVALGDTNTRFRGLTDPFLGEKVRKRCPFMLPRTGTPTMLQEPQKEPTQTEKQQKPTESWRLCARLVLARQKQHLITLSEGHQDPLVYSLKVGMKTLNYVLKTDLDACQGLIDTNNHVEGEEDMKKLCREILDHHQDSPVTVSRPNLSHVTFPEQGVHNFIHHPHPDFTFFSMLQPKGWFLYCAIDKNPLLPIFGPFAFSHPDSFRVFVYDGVVWVDFDGAVLPFVVDAEDNTVRFCKQKMIHGYPEQQGRAFVQGKGELSRYLCNMNGKRICDLESGVNYFLEMGTDRLFY